MGAASGDAPASMAALRGVWWLGMWAEKGVAWMCSTREEEKE